MSPNAMTDSRPMPWAAASSATTLALETPSAAASISPLELECVTLTRPSSAGRASASRSSQL